MNTRGIKNRKTKGVRIIILMLVTGFAAGMLVQCGTPEDLLGKVEKQVEEAQNMTTYTVMYDGNGEDSGKAPEDSIEYPEGETVTVKDSGTLALSGNTFTNWDTKSNGNGTDYVVGSTFPMPASDVVFYAEWTTNPTYTVTYYGHGEDGGSVPEDNNNYEEGNSVTVSGPGTLSRTGYDFLVWNTQEDNNGVPQEPGDVFTMGDSDVDLWAQWTEASYTVSYDGNGGGPAPPSEDYDYNEEVTVADQGSITRENYTFMGWETDSGDSFNGGDTFLMPANNVTLHAQWSINSYTVTYHSNDDYGGSVPPPQTAEYNTQITVRDNTGDLHMTADPDPYGEAKESFKFTGWNEHPDGYGEHYDAGSDVITVTEDINLYAEWDEYQLRDRGPSGGWIFYKKTSFDDGWRYLEAHDSDEYWFGSYEHEWGTYGYDIPNQGGAPELWGIGDGQANTDEIMPNVNYNTAAEAAELCDENTVTNNGIEFDDWFLPSCDELMEMYDELHDQTPPVGGFVDAFYWTSTELSAYMSYAQGFHLSGANQFRDKDEPYRVRAARAF